MKNPVATIIKEKDTYRYFDKNGTELRDGDIIRYDSGNEEKLYLTMNGRLGMDATNPSWVKSGRAIPCEYGVYPLEYSETKEIVKVEE